MYPVSTFDERIGTGPIRPIPTEDEGPAGMVSFPCNSCGGEDTHPWLESTDYISGETFNIVRCARCDLTYLNPRPPHDRIVRYYPQTHQSSEPAAYERMDAKPRIKFVGSLLN